MEGLSRSARWSMAVFVVVLMGAGALLLIPALMMMSIGGSDTEGVGGDTAAVPCGPSVTVGGQTVDLDSEQIANARAVIQTGLELGVPDRGLVVGVATALQESSLNNVGFGDRDSIGLFQQRGGWGSHADRSDVERAATLFFTGGKQGAPGLLDIDGWTGMSVAEAAQAVQRSAYPLAYAKWEPTARRLVSATLERQDLGCGDALATGLPAGSVGTMLKTALAQQGAPYVWGAVGPSAFDCSGLVVWSWRQAGYRLTVRTASQMYDVSTPVPRAQAQPGDLLFGDFGDRGPGPGHVMIVIGGGKAVQAPATGRTVEITDYSSFGSSWVTGRLKSSAMKPIG